MYDGILINDSDPNEAEDLKIDRVMSPAVGGADVGCSTKDTTPTSSVGTADSFFLLSYVAPSPMSSFFLILYYSVLYAASRKL